MIRRIEQWPIDKVYKIRDQFYHADYQRNPRLWKSADKQLLIDSILTDIDIPKIYLNEIGNDQYEIVDGQQRLYAIWEFINNDYSLDNSELPSVRGKKFKNLTEAMRDVIFSYKLQFAIIKDAPDEYLRNLFLRLQLGLLLVAGEKLNALTGEMRDFIFKTMVEHPFVKKISIRNIRYAKQALCAQICINSFRKAKLEVFSRTRYDDLESFFKEYRIITGPEKKFFDERCGYILNILNIIDDYFGKKIEKVRNRSLILSIYLFVEDRHRLDRKRIQKEMPSFVRFTLRLVSRLKEEAKKGFNRTNEELYRLESYLSNAPGEKYQIKNRHEKLNELFNYFQKTGKIKGDK